jgi:hypothetical protein
MGNVILRYLDVVSTGYLIRNGFDEVNPVVNKIMEIYGVTTGLTITFFLSFLFLLLIYFSPSKWSLTVLKFLLVLHLILIGFHGICWLALFGLI